MEHHVMIWLSALSLVAGGVLAWHFKIIVLAPATFVIAAIAIAVGQMQTTGTGIPSIILTIAIATAGTQIGYFLAMLFQYVMGAPLLRSSSPSSNERTARAPSISRTSIS
jgi:hypothetical protein